MKDYLSSDERKHMARLGAIITTADDAVEDYSKLKGVDKDFLKSLRMMGSFALRALKTRLQYLPPTVVSHLLDTSRQYTIAAQLTSAAKAEQKEWLQLETVVGMTKEHFYNLVEFTISGYCKKCDGTIQKCPLKELFDIYEVPIPYNEIPTGCCVYSYMSQHPIEDESDGDNHGQNC